MSSVTPTCTLLGQQAEPACVQQSKCSHCFQSKLEDIGLNADIHMVSRAIIPYRLQLLTSSSLNIGTSGPYPAILSTLEPVICQGMKCRGYKTPALLCLGPVLPAPAFPFDAKLACDDVGV